MICTVKCLHFHKLKMTDGTFKTIINKQNVVKLKRITDETLVHKNQNIKSHQQKFNYKFNL